MHHEARLESTASGRQPDHPRGRAAVALAGVLLLGFGTGAGAGTIDPSSVDWSVYALIDNSETILGVDQSTSPRDIRGLEISDAREFLYAGYNNPSGAFEVRQLDLTQSGNASFVNRVAGLRGKAIATDDMGRVYLAEGDRVEVRSADLQTSLGTITGLQKTEGIDVVRVGGQLVMYASDRTGDDLTKYVLTEGGGAITAATVDAGFGTAGKVALGSDPRGVTVDASGVIWVADRGTDRLYRILPDGTLTDGIAFTNPFDVAVVEGLVLVTLELQVAVLDASTLTVSNLLDIPWAALGLDGLSANGGIAVDPSLGFYVANEGGQTLLLPDGTDDNDPILLAGFHFTVAEPGVLALMSLGLLALRTGRRTSRRPARASLVNS